MLIVSYHGNRIHAKRQISSLLLKTHISPDEVGFGTPCPL